ncbi:hypothetical protein ACCS93_38380, partial [Rhizobium ruizarguesonis]
GQTSLRRSGYKTTEESLSFLNINPLSDPPRHSLSRTTKHLSIFTPNHLPTSFLYPNRWH